MELPQSNTLLPVCSYTRTELLSLRTKTSLLSLSTVDRLKDLNIGYHVFVVNPTPPTCCQQSPAPESCGSQQSLPTGGKERLHFVGIRPEVHRSSRGAKRKKHNLHSFIVASFNAQSVKGNDMACKRCEISTFIKDNGVDLFLWQKHGLVLMVTKQKLLN